MFQEIDKNCKCKICPKSFSCRGSLKRHQRTVHENVKPFNFEICLYNFATKAHWNVHQKLNLTEYETHQRKLQRHKIKCQDKPCFKVKTWEKTIGNNGQFLKDSTMHFHLLVTIFFSSVTCVIF